MESTTQMAATTVTVSRRKPKTREEKPLRLKTRDDATKYLAKHLTPVGYNPRGYPIYAKKDIDALNIILPEDD
jgi:hypothetical protein